MPRVSSFYGITIWMYYDEVQHLGRPHFGRPHFHARYGEAEASVGIGSLAIIAGDLPPRARRLVIEWAAFRQADLRENWVRARSHQPLKSIEPLP